MIRSVICDREDGKGLDEDQSNITPQRFLYVLLRLG